MTYAGRVWIFGREMLLKAPQSSRVQQYTPTPRKLFKTDLVSGFSINSLKWPLIFIHLSIKFLLSEFGSVTNHSQVSWETCLLRVLGLGLWMDMTEGTLLGEDQEAPPLVFRKKPPPQSASLEAQSPMPMRCCKAVSTGTAPHPDPWGTLGGSHPTPQSRATTEAVVHLDLLLPVSCF